MENLEEMFTSARAAKMNTDNHIHEREELYQKKAIDFLDKYHFNKVITKACEERRFSISPIPIKEKELAYAVRDVLVVLGYTARAITFNGTYSVNVNWNSEL